MTMPLQRSLIPNSASKFNDLLIIIINQKTKKILELKSGGYSTLQKNITLRYLRHFRQVYKQMADPSGRTV
jgi:hypothetical protein